MKTLIVPFLVLLTACSSTPEIEYIQAQCDIPAQPVLPVIDAGELWDLLTQVPATESRGVDYYNMLADREMMLASWSLTLQAMLEAACND